MTDNRTTELLPCPLCKGEAEVIEADYGMYKTGYAVYCRKCCLKLGVTGRLGEAYEWSPVFNTEAEAIAAWNARAERGTLTAEQVREAIMSVDRWEKPMGNTGMTNTHLIIRDDGWQAIADELNARVGRTCELKGRSDTCTECGASVERVTHSVYEMGDGFACHPNYCPNCGAKVIGG